MTLYADVILPLPLYSSFTYILPEQFKEQVQTGSRVLVPFGEKRGCHTGIVEAIHTNAPEPGIAVKEIILPLDSKPILRSPQLKFWHWISEYYLCAPGEVMKAALPAALKVESESWLSPNPDLDSTAIESLDDKEATAFAHISHAKRIRIADLEKELQITSPRATINRLIEAGLVQISERVVDKYITKKVSLIQLNCDRKDQETLHSYFNRLKRSQSQEKLLIAYLDMSGWLHPDTPLRPVERKTLLERSNVSTAILKALIDKGIFTITHQKVNRFSQPSPHSDTSLPPLSEAQQQALRNIHRAMHSKLVTLLRGVTGSGKTEIYSHLITEVLTHGDHALMLVPEISLTTQLTTRLRRIFGDRLIVYHSKFSDSERVDIWRRLISSSAPMLILGVRSSIFLPFPRLGLIIVDEEHESSYKQFDPAPRYNARDAAIMLAAMHGAKVLLGSATPSIDTYYKAQNGKYGLVELLERYGDVSLPKVEIIDMRERRKHKMTTGPFSSDLLSATSQALRQDRQAIIFQNRRGYAPIVICDQCGWTPLCPNCDVSLVYHKSSAELRCHYCGHSAHLPNVCPACGSNAIQTFGYGTERLADYIQQLMPEAKISRMDTDTTRNKDAYQEIIEEFSHKKTQILVGTQMVSKGLDFAGVSFVGVVNADTLLNFPDFRSNERAFNMMEQVAGRAGRHGQTGRVMIQTTNPSHNAIQAVIDHDYQRFYTEELEQRKRYSYPPFTKVINIYLRHKDEKTLIDIAVKYTMAMQSIFGKRVLGPESPSVTKIGGYHIRTLMLKVEAGASMSKVKHLLRRIEVSLANLNGMKTLRLHYDVDPA